MRSGPTTNTTPWSGGAGKSVIVTGTPVCNPTPSHVTGFRIEC